MADQKELLILSASFQSPPKEPAAVAIETAEPIVKAEEGEKEGKAKKKKGKVIA